MYYSRIAAYDGPIQKHALCVHGWEPASINNRTNLPITLINRCGSATSEIRHSPGHSRDTRIESGDEIWRRKARKPRARWTGRQLHTNHDHIVKCVCLTSLWLFEICATVVGGRILLFSPVQGVSGGCTVRNSVFLQGNKVVVFILTPTQWFILI